MKDELKERIKKLQNALGVKADGMIGPVTLTKIENIVYKSIPQIPTEPTYSLIVTKKGIDQLIEFEISSESYYNKKLKNPIWPKGQSGITIGIGYDLGYTTVKDFLSDWGGRILEKEIKLLTTVVGLKGEKANQSLNKVKNIEIKYVDAKEVFYIKTLPKYAKETANAFPGILNLFPDAQSMLLSVIYNRGNKINAPQTGIDAGKEQREIRRLINNNLKEKDIEAISQQILLMKRLVNPQIHPGLITRRNKEAEIIKNSKRDYKEEELIRI